MRRQLMLLASLLLMLPPTFAAAAETLRYQATFDAATQGMRVRACLSETHARASFAADSEWAKRFVADIARGDARPLVEGEDGWNAFDWRAGECLAYRADLAAIAAQKKPDIGWRMREDLVAAPQLWLLRPDVQADDTQIRVELPPGWSISAPWQELSREETPLAPSSAPSMLAHSPAARAKDVRSPPSTADLPMGKTVRFRIADTPADWSASVALGRFDEQRITLPGGVLRVAILGGVDAARHEKLMRWFGRVARAVTSAYGRLPLADVQVLMLPVDVSGQAVVFGQSVRGQGNALHLLIDPSRPEAEFDDDWMAVHELAHLMHPYLGDRGSWLAEGLATYFQNVLRARGGLLTTAQGWDRLKEGFRRGAAARGEGTLEQMAASMHRTQAYQRVYWAGAAFWLTVDRDLRRESAGGIGLDTALSRFRDCCLPAYRQWRPEEFVAKLDALAGTALIAARYREFAAMRRFPDWNAVYADLGVRETDGRLSFDNAARGTAIREAIMRAK